MLDIEERYDMVFSRPFGLVIARWAARMHLNPTDVSMMSLLVGCSGAVLFLWQDVYAFAVVGSIAIVISGLLDSADGQLARMTNSSTELGRIIDGMIDTLVFIVAYVLSAVYLFDVIGVWQSYFWASLAGYAHSLKSSVYELHKAEYLFYIGKFASFRLPNPDEVRRDFVRENAFQWFTYVLYLDYCKKQQYMGFRPTQVRDTFERYSKLPDGHPDAERFRELYTKGNQRMLFWWAWVGGTNIQRAGLLTSILMGHYEVYLYANSFSLIPFVLIGLMQRRTDAEILRQLEDSRG